MGDNRTTLNKIQEQQIQLILPRHRIIMQDCIAIIRAIKII